MSFLYDTSGKRKYLTMAERKAFLLAARKASPEIYSFCATLVYTGARISEVLALTAEHLDLQEEAIIFESLKKRKKGVYRAIPIPSSLITLLDDIHRIRETQKNSSTPAVNLWPWCRTTAWKKVSDTMKRANIVGACASAKGLRHGFAVAALQQGIPITLVQKWLGHSRLETTAIYTQAVGPEERKFAERLWLCDQNSILH